jgi:hypothetical protein
MTAEERRLRLVDTLDDVAREEAMNTELESARRDIRRALSARQRWLRRIARIVQSNRTTVR